MDKIYQEPENSTEQHITVVFNSFKDSIQSGDIEYVDQMLQNNKVDLVNRVDPQEYKISSFYISSIDGQQQCADMLQLLFDKGLDINFKNNLNQNLIFYLARDGQNQAMKLAHELGANLDDPDQYGQTPLYYASRDGRKDTVELLLNSGANVNHTDALQHQTALFYAAREGQIDIVKFLVEKGANPYHTDTKKQSALNYAKKKNKDEVVAFLSSLQVHQLVIQVNENTSNLKLKIFTDDQGKSTELTKQDFENFKEQYPDISKLLLNADELILGQTEDQTSQQGKDKEKESWQKMAKKIMAHLWKVKGAYIFHSPVDPIELKIEDYFTIIKRPMDFGSIKNNLNNNVYDSFSQFVNDIEQVFYNCELYNGRDSSINQMSQFIKKEFDNQLLINKTQKT